MGFIMIALMIYVTVKAVPPVGEAVYRTFVPEKLDVIAIVTLVGGTVGGYYFCWRTSFVGCRD